MAALSSTWILRNSGRILSSKCTYFGHQSSIVSCKQIFIPVLYKHAKVCRFSTSNVWKNEGQSQPSKSSLPFGEMLQKAEQEQKEKEKSEDEKARKKKRKEKIKRIQKWALGISGALMVGSSILSIYEMGKPSSALKSSSNSNPVCQSHTGLHDTPIDL